MKSNEEPAFLEPEVEPRLALRHGLTEEEYERLKAVLGRVPTYTELGIYSVMWSEHCSYKNSIAVLKTFPRSGSRVLVEAGEENAGLVDIGDGLAIAFKIESHNHPSAVEPYEGAATGVGGILRDIFTMGARPVAALNSLRFGDLVSPHTRYLVREVVRGIGDYGNCFGVPTVGGEVTFDPCYAENPLVNAMAVGVVRRGEHARAAADGPGNPVFIVGSSTGRDGIHGATFASEEISSESDSKRPSVQVGDPFTEKLLLEATLEVLKTGAVVGIQDMGAAGITCSTSEMSARAGTGMRIDLDRVPVRESGMTAYEIMLSESQERMLLVAQKGREEEILRVYAKWDLHAERIGEVTDSGRLEVLHLGRLVADVPAHSLVLGGGAPVYIREAVEPAYLVHTRGFDAGKIPLPADLNGCLLRLLGGPNLCSREWVWEQYDGMVRNGSVQLHEGDAAVILVPGTRKALALTTDCNARYVYLNPRRGGEIAVAEAARNVVCVGAEPVAITNCLNFGNPYKPEVFWQFREAVAGMGEACRVLGTPVTGGNVSFYNESPGGQVFPTPVVGMLGVCEDAARTVGAGFSVTGDAILQLGKTRGHLGGTEYLSLIHGIVSGDAPPVELMAEKRLQQACLTAIRRGLVRSAHDCSEGGLAVALAECCILGEIGAVVAHEPGFLRPDAWLFGEDQSRILISAAPRDVPAIRDICQSTDVPFSQIGQVGGGELRIGALIRLALEEMARSRRDTLPTYLT
ncbi:MAG: phosphoribosylformylglycinamidine synthase subunit PurL [Bacteroidota bacterium]